jgi:hypothetical protein
MNSNRRTDHLPSVAADHSALRGNPAQRIGMSTLFVGDVHGCAEELAAMVEQAGGAQIVLAETCS